MSDQPAPVQTIALRADGVAAQAFFAVVTHSEMQHALAEPHWFLNQTELTHWKALRVENKRHSALQGRIAAKRALGAALGEVDLTKIEIVRGTFGQPLVRHARAAGVDVTLSHSGGLAVALAYPDALPMGIDLEQVAASSAPTVLGELQLSDAERAWLAQHGVQPGVAPAVAPARAAALAQGGAPAVAQGGSPAIAQADSSHSPIDEAIACGMLWSAREALGKSLKTGLNSPLGVFALERLQPAADSAGVPRGTVAWIGDYLNFPRTQCLIQHAGSGVLALALPRAATLAGWPRWPFFS